MIERERQVDIRSKKYNKNLRIRDIKLIKYKINIKLKKVHMKKVKKLNFTINKINMKRKKLLHLLSQIMKKIIKIKNNRLFSIIEK